MKNKKTYYQLILDRSGSMTLFNHQITPVLDRILPADLREIAFS